MGLFTFLLAFMLILADSTNDSTLLNRSRQQAEHYITQIQENRDSEIYFWALAQLCDGHTEVRTFIDTLSGSEQGISLPLKPFCGDRSYNELIEELAFRMRSPDLFIAALISHSSISSQQKLRDRYIQEIGFPSKSAIQYQELTKQIIQGGAIDSQMLPHKPFEFLHFLLFYNNNLIRNGILPVPYFEKSSSAWLSSEPSFKTPGLKRSIFEAALLRALYMADEYSIINELNFSFIQDKFLPISSVRMSIYSALDYSMYRLGYYDKSLEVARTTQTKRNRIKRFNAPRGIFDQDWQNGRSTTSQFGSFRASKKT